MMLLDICPKEYDLPFALDLEFTLTDAISSHARRQHADTSQKQYIIDAVAELLSLPDPVTVYFESDMLDSNVIQSVVPILRGCCT